MDDGVKNILPGELLKVRNNLVKKLVTLQGKSIYSYKTGDGIIKRMDDLFALQAAIKKLDILIPFVIKNPVSWQGLSLFVDIGDEEKFNPGFKTLKDYKVKKEIK